MRRIAALLILCPRLALADPLIPSPPLYPDLAAMPRLASTTQAAQRINANLAEHDRIARQNHQDCKTSPAAYNRRQITITAQGPAFLALLVTDSYFCTDTIHPFLGQFSLTYDLTAGTLVDWRDLVPASWLPGPGDDTHLSDTTVIASAALTQAYLTGLNLPPQDECRRMIEADPQGYFFWLDPANRALVVQPATLPFPDLTCQTPLPVPLETLQTLAAAPALISAL